VLLPNVSACRVRSSNDRRWRYSRHCSNCDRWRRCRWSNCSRSIVLDPHAASFQPRTTQLNSTPSAYQNPSAFLGIITDQSSSICSPVCHIRSIHTPVCAEHLPGTWWSKTFGYPLSAWCPSVCVVYCCRHLLQRKTQRYQSIYKSSLTKQLNGQSCHWLTTITWQKFYVAIVQLSPPVWWTLVSVMP